MTEGNKHIYTCSDYRLERILLALKMRLSNNEISQKEKQYILSEIKKIEVAMEMEDY